MLFQMIKTAGLTTLTGAAWMDVLTRKVLEYQAKHICQSMQGLSNYMRG